MQISEIKVLFQYNYWANKRILSTAEKITPGQFSKPDNVSWGSLHGTFVHIMEAEEAWRVMCQSSNINYEEMTPDNYPTIEAIRTRWDKVERDMVAYLDSLTDEDLSGIISYDVRGKTRTRVLWHCLLHVVNHGTQHRSECALMLTKFNQSPGEIDFTVFLNPNLN